MLLLDRSNTHFVPDNFNMIQMSLLFNYWADLLIFHWLFKSVVITTPNDFFNHDVIVRCFFDDKSLIRCTNCFKDVRRLQNTCKMHEWKINVIRSINLATWARSQRTRLLYPLVFQWWVYPFARPPLSRFDNERKLRGTWGHLQGLLWKRYRRYGRLHNW